MANVSVDLIFDWQLDNDFRKVIENGEYTINTAIEADVDDFEDIVEKLYEHLHSEAFFKEINDIKYDFDLKYYIRLFLSTIVINNKEYDVSEILEDDYILYFDYENDFDVDIVD